VRDLRAVAAGFAVTAAVWLGLPLMRRGEPGWWVGAAATGLIGGLLFVLDLDIRRRSAAVAPLTANGAALVISPLGLAVQQGDLSGHLTWQEIRKVNLRSVRGSLVFRGSLVVGSAQNLPGILLEVEGTNILLTNSYDRPLSEVHNSILRLLALNGRRCDPTASHRRISRRARPLSLVLCLRKTVLKGQIAVGGSDVRKIAVRVVPEKDIKAYLDNKVPQALVAPDKRQTGFERASRAADSAIRDYQTAFDNARGRSQTRDGVIVTPTDNGTGAFLLYDPKQHTEADAKAIGLATLGDANRQRAAAAERFGAEKPLLDQALAAGHQTKEGARLWWIAWETEMLADLPEVGTVLFTNEKGRFTKREPRGGKVAVFASGHWMRQRPTLPSSGNLVGSAEAALLTVGKISGSTAHRRISDTAPSRTPSHHACRHGCGT
jgi:hypothetical protein